MRLRHGGTKKCNVKVNLLSGPLQASCQVVSANLHGMQRSDRLVVLKLPRDLSTVPEAASEDNKVEAIMRTKAAPTPAKWIQFESTNRCPRCIADNRKCIMDIASPLPSQCFPCRTQRIPCQYVMKERDRAEDDVGRVLVVEVPRVKELRRSEKMNRPGFAIRGLRVPFEEISKAKKESADALDAAGDAMTRIADIFVLQ